MDEYLGAIYEESDSGETRRTVLLVSNSYADSAVPLYLHATDRVVKLPARS